MFYLTGAARMQAPSSQIMMKSLRLEQTSERDPTQGAMEVINGYFFNNKIFSLHKLYYN